MTSNKTNGQLSGQLEIKSNQDGTLTSYLKFHLLLTNILFLLKLAIILRLVKFNSMDILLINL